MKLANRKYIYIFLSCTLTIAVGFAVIQANQEEELIVGTWIPEGNTEGKWVFSSDKKLKKYQNGQLSNSYDYSISEEVSANGKLTHSFLTVANISNSNDVFEYEINAIDEDNLVLEYLAGARSQLLYFTKQ